MDVSADRSPARPFLRASGVFTLLFLVLPFAESVGLIPVMLLPLGKWLYVLAAVGACVAAAALSVPRERRRFVAARVALVLICCVAPVALGLTAFGALTDDFTSIEIVSQSTSQDGRFVLVHKYIDQGALGGSDAVYVTGRLLPGIIEWQYQVPFDIDASPLDVGWHDASAVFVDGSTHKLPIVMLMFGW